MAQRYTVHLARELENCKKQLKFLAQNDVTVESVLKKNEAKRKRDIATRQRLLKTKNPNQSNKTGVDAVLADILADEERRKKRLQKEAAAAANNTPHPSEYKDGGRFEGGRKTRRKRRRRKRKSRRKKKTHRRRKKRKIKKKKVIIKLN